MCHFNEAVILHQLGIVKETYLYL